MAAVRKNSNKFGAVIFRTNFISLQQDTGILVDKSFNALWAPHAALRATRVLKFCRICCNSNIFALMLPHCARRN